MLSTFLWFHGPMIEPQRRECGTQIMTLLLRASQRHLVWQSQRADLLRAWTRCVVFDKEKASACLGPATLRRIYDNTVSITKRDLLASPDAMLSGTHDRCAKFRCRRTRKYEKHHSRTSKSPCSRLEHVFRWPISMVLSTNRSTEVRHIS